MRASLLAVLINQIALPELTNWLRGRHASGTPLTDVYLARLERFAASFATRADLDAYLASTHFTADEAETLERLLPARLAPKMSASPSTPRPTAGSQSPSRALRELLINGPRIGCSAARSMRGILAVRSPSTRILSSARAGKEVR